MTLIKNPILRGFNPDPSIVRIGEDYYIATSTFEWFPGVQIHHSRDLVNWKLVTRPLNRIEQLNMRGNPDSCGVWAPCLSYDQGKYYLVYSNVRSFDGVWKDTPNYLVTTDDILGEWSDPIFLDSSGFDGSLFHDNDGRKYFLSMTVDHRKGKFFGDIIIQEYDHKLGKLTGAKNRIFEGTDLGKTEGPHLYKINEFYYLITAEGGTEYGHAVTIARSKSIFGPYEVHPDNPLISSRDYPEAYLQKCGHGDIVQTETGRWLAVFLSGRPLTKQGRCTLGRETSMAWLKWKNGWPYLEKGAQVPQECIEIESDSSQLKQKIEDLNKFDTNKLGIHFQSLRVPISEDWCSLNSRPGYLRIKGRESLSSLHFQSLLARRVQHFHVNVETGIDFKPTGFQQMAGLVCYYNTGHWFYLHIMGDEDGASKYLQIISCDNFQMQDVLDQPINLTPYQDVVLGMDFDKNEIQFYYKWESGENIKVGSVLDGSILSDDYVRDGSERYKPAFTGAFVGICCQDLSGQGVYADFNYFNYKEK